jgi:hypothetical protein
MARDERRCPLYPRWFPIELGYVECARRKVVFLVLIEITESAIGSELPQPRHSGQPVGRLRNGPPTSGLGGKSGPSRSSSILSVGLHS